MHSLVADEKGARISWKPAYLADALLRIDRTVRRRDGTFGAWQCFQILGIFEIESFWRTWSLHDPTNGGHDPKEWGHGPIFKGHGYCE